MDAPRRPPTDQQAKILKLAAEFVVFRDSIEAAVQAQDPQNGDISSEVGPGLTILYPRQSYAGNPERTATISAE